MNESKPFVQSAQDPLTLELSRKINTLLDHLVDNNLESMKILEDLNYTLRTMQQETLQNPLIDHTLLEILMNSSTTFLNRNTHLTAEVQAFYIFGLELLEDSLFSNGIVEKDVIVDILSCLETLLETGQGAETAKILPPPVPLEIFHEEYGELLEELEGLVSLSSDKHSLTDESLMNVKRVLHTLKGSACLVGFDLLGHFVHQLESVAEQEPVSHVEKILIQVLNYLKDQSENIRLGYNINPPLKLLSCDLVQSNQGKKKKTTLNRDVKSDTIPSVKVKVSQVAISQLSDHAAINQVLGFQLAQKSAAIQVKLLTLRETLSKLDRMTRDLVLHTDSTLIPTKNFDKEKTNFDQLELDNYTAIHRYVREIQDVSSTIIQNHHEVKDQLNTIQTELRLHKQSALRLNSILTTMRLVSFTSVIPRLESITQKVSLLLKKDVQLVYKDNEGEMDRNLLKHLISPLEHMIRNAIDHGIESPEERLRLGKTSRGTLALSCIPKASKVHISLRDDGRGLSLDAIRKKAYEEHWFEEHENPSDNQLMALLFQSGFSTSQEVTAISGRGIGMDSAYVEIIRVGGHIEVKSEPGQWTEFTIVIPFTTSLNKVMFFQSNNQYYGVLLNTLEGLTRSSSDPIHSKQEEDTEFKYFGKKYRLYDFGSFFQSTHPKDPHTERQNRPVLLIPGDPPLALLVDKIIGPQEIIMKSLGVVMQNFNVFLGASLLGDGHVALVVEPIALATLAKRLQSVRTKSSHMKEVLVVDDSSTVRRVVSQFLKNHGFKTRVAKNGVEALTVLEKCDPLCILLDLEMPIMDGFTFLETYHQKVKKPVPVVVITSRSIEKYQKKVLELGAYSMMSKPFQEFELLTLLQLLQEGNQNEQPE